MLDKSKNVFLAPNCSEDPSLRDKVLRVLESHKIPKEKIRQDVDMDILHSGDYLIRCFADKIQAWEIQLTLPFGFMTKLIGNL